MDVKTCLQLLWQIKDVAFATVDRQGRPQVRIIDVMLVEKDRLYFVTARGKEFYQQLLCRGEAAVTGLTSEFVMIRLRGRVTKLSQPEPWLTRVFDANPSMNQVYPGASREILEVFCLLAEEVEYFDLAQHPICRRQFFAGAEPGREQGFQITAACRSCRRNWRPRRKKPRPPRAKTNSCATK